MTEISFTAEHWTTDAVANLDNASGTVSSADVKDLPVYVIDGNYYVHNGLSLRPATKVGENYTAPMTQLIRLYPLTLEIT